MSIRASLYVDFDERPKPLAESKTWIPLCWLALLSSEDVKRITDTGYVIADRKAAVGRLVGITPFLATLFPEFQSFVECADVFLTALRKTRGVTVGIDLGDHVAIAPETFPDALAAAVAAIEERNPNRSLVLPARQGQNPFTRKPITIKAQTLKDTRAVLCHTAGLDPVTTDEEIERDQLIGYLLTLGITQLVI